MPAAILAVLVLGLTIFSFESAFSIGKTAKEIDVSVDVALEQFEKQVRGGKEFLASGKGVLVLPSVVKAGVGICG
jgi:lipid-binding SYLF domain-containing protein